jgi:integrase
MWYDDASGGKRREHRTRILASAPEQEINKYIYENFLQEKEPDFGAGNPAQVKIATCLTAYLDAKEEEAEHTPTLRIEPIRIALRNLTDFVTEKFVAQWDRLNDSNHYVQWRIKRGDGVMATTAGNDLIYLNAALNYCVDKELLWKAPRIKVPPRPKNRHPRFLTQDEFTLAMWGALGWDRDGVRRHRPHYALARFLILGTFTGTREDRILRLQKSENHLGGFVDLAAGLLHRKAAHEPDTRKLAPTVALPSWPTADDRRNKLRAHLERWCRLSRAYLIEGRHGGPLTDAAIQKQMKIVCRRMGINTDATPKKLRVTPHTLRHTCVTWMLAAGVSCFNAGKYVGMSEHMVESVYGHSSESVERRTASAIGRQIITGTHGSVAVTVADKKLSR